MSSFDEIAALVISCLDIIDKQLMWVAYTLSELVSAVEEDKLVPTASDRKCTIRVGKTETVLDNSAGL